MFSFAAIRATTNPYLSQLFESVKIGTIPLLFSWRRAVMGRFDVLHIHWPEVLIRGSTRPKTWARRIAFVLVLLQLKLSRRALVRTLHNIAPHERGDRVEQWLLKWCDRETTLWITLTDSTPLPVPATPSVHIVHGHYRDIYDLTQVPMPVRGRLTYFGLVRAYKGLSELIQAFVELDDDNASLRISGKSQDRVLSARIRDAEAQHSNISSHLEYLRDPDLLREIGEAQIVVLPYNEMHNSGAALLALSLARPILVPANAVTRALAEEVGSAWVKLFHPPLSADNLRSALAKSTDESGPAILPDLSHRDWAAIGASHVEAYRRASHRHLRQRGTTRSTAEH